MKSAVTDFNVAGRRTGLDGYAIGKGLVVSKAISLFTLLPTFFSNLKNNL